MHLVPGEPATLKKVPIPDQGVKEIDLAARMNPECMTTRPPGSSPRYFLNDLYIQILKFFDDRATFFRNSASTRHSRRANS